MGESKKKRWPGGSENEWFLECCDSSDVIDGELCIISIMRGSGGNVNRLLPGVGGYVDDRKEVTTGREKWLGPHSHLCSLFGNTQQARAPQLRGALFQLENALEPGVLRAHPLKPRYSAFCFYPLSGWLQCRLRPIAKAPFAQC